MKKSMNFIASAVAAVALLLSINSNAQMAEPPHDSRAVRLGIGANLGAPTNDAYNFAWGGDLRLQKDFSGNVSGLISGGYTRFSLEGDRPGDVGFIPVKVGLKVFPVAKLYVSGEAGAGF